MTGPAAAAPVPGEEGSADPLSGGILVDELAGFSGIDAGCAESGGAAVPPPSTGGEVLWLSSRGGEGLWLSSTGVRDTGWPPSIGASTAPAGLRGAGVWGVWTDAAGVGWPAAWLTGRSGAVDGPCRSSAWRRLSSSCSCRCSRSTRAASCQTTRVRMITPRTASPVTGGDHMRGAGRGRRRREAGGGRREAEAGGGGGRREAGGGRRRREAGGGRWEVGRGRGRGRGRGARAAASRPDPLDAARCRGRRVPAGARGSRG